MGNFPPYLLYPRSSPKLGVYGGGLHCNSIQVFFILIKKNVCCEKRETFKTGFVF